MPERPSAPADEDRAVPAAAPSDRTAELESQVGQLEDRWRRALADLDNLRKWCAREVDRARGDERARVAAEWLPVVDNLELALQHAGADPDAVLEGVRAVHEQAIGTLARLGFVRQDAVGEPFDPARHEAVGATADTDALPGTVVRVVRPGYGEGERQLRPAAVVVAKRDE
jgi:molecular chaperone GrpE